MVSAAILRSVSRSLRLQQPLQQQQRCLMERRFLSSSVPTKRYPSSSTHSREAMEQKSRVNGKEDVYERLLIKLDKISDGLDEHMRPLKQLEVQIEENNKNGGAIDLTPWILSVLASLMLIAFIIMYKADCLCRVNVRRGLIAFIIMLTCMNFLFLLVEVL